MGSEERHKTKVIGVRVSEVEKVEFEEKAKAAGLSVPSFIRQAILEYVVTTPPRNAPPPLDLKRLSVIVGALGKIGNNLNQIAHRLNEGQGVGQDRIISAIEQLSITMNELLKVIKAKSHDNKRKEPE